MKFIIRDDDACGYTKPEEIENFYKNIFPFIPICISVTPFRIPGYFGEDPIEFWGIPKEYYGELYPIPLIKNNELLSFLKNGINNEYIDVALHGYNHVSIKILKEQIKTKNYIPQISGREYLYSSDLLRKTKEGKKILEDLLDCKINTFVPPGNAISREGLEAIINNNLNLVGTYPHSWRIFKKPNIAYKKIKWKIIHPGQKYPFILDFNNHKEITFYSLGPLSDLNKLKKELDFCYSVNGVFILSTHYHAFYKKIKSDQTVEYALHSIIEYANKKNNIEFIRYKELW